MGPRSSFGYVYKPKGRNNWYVRLEWEGRRVVRLGGTTRGAADRKRNRAHAMLLDGKSLEEVLAQVFNDESGARLCFADLARLYLKHAVHFKRRSTLLGDVHRMDILCAAPWSSKLVSRVRPEEINRWSAERMGGGTSGATVNRDLSLASAIYRWGVEQGLCEENPFRKARRQSEKGRKKETYLTAPEAIALLKAASESFRPLLRCAIATGMRRGELLSLCWPSVDFTNRLIHVSPENEKTGRGRAIPMSTDLLAIFEALDAVRKVLRMDRTDPVFLRQDGHAWTVSSLRKAFDKTKDQCVDLPEAKKDVLRFHDLRHTAASLMVTAGVPLYTVGKVLGHSTPQTTARYAHLAPEAERSAVDVLEEALRAGAKQSRGGTADTAGA